MVRTIPAFARAWGQDASLFKTQDPGKGFRRNRRRFHTGDDLQWAQPGYDDSGGELFGDTWGAQTHPSYVGFAWYRKRIEVTPANAQVALLMRPVDDIYEIYWNGKRSAATARCRQMPTGTPSSTP